jgi:hypothetical protein
MNEEEVNKIEKKHKKKEVNEKKLEARYEYYAVFPNDFLFEYYNLKKK